MLAFKIVDKEFKNAVLNYAIDKGLTVDTDWVDADLGFISIGTSKKYQIAGNSTDAPYVKKGVDITDGIVNNAALIFTAIKALVVNDNVNNVSNDEEGNNNEVETEALVKLHTQIKKSKKSPKNYNLMIVQGEYKAVILDKVYTLITNGAEDLGNIAKLMQNV